VSSVTVKGRTDNRNVKIEYDRRHINIEEWVFSEGRERRTSVRIPAEHAQKLSALIDEIVQEAVKLRESLTRVGG